jgi:hypothetical protein
MQSDFNWLRTWIIRWAGEAIPTIKPLNRETACGTPSSELLLPAQNTCLVNLRENFPAKVIRFHSSSVPCKKEGTKRPPLVPNSSNNLFFHND